MIQLPKPTARWMMCFGKVYCAKVRAGFPKRVRTISHGCSGPEFGWGIRAMARARLLMEFRNSARLLRWWSAGGQLLEAFTIRQLTKFLSDRWIPGLLIVESQHGPASEVLLKGLWFLPAAAKPIAVNGKSSRMPPSQLSRWVLWPTSWHG